MAVNNTLFTAAGNDPWVQQTKNLFEAQRKAEAAQLQAQAQRAFIDFGGSPDFSSLGLTTQTQPWLAYFNQKTRALADANTQAGTSVMARLQKQLADANRTTVNQMAARGILRSGETGYQLGENALQNKQATYDAGRQLLDFLSGAQAAVAQHEQERQFQLLQAQQDAAVRQQELQFRQQEMAQQMALAQQQMAMSQAAAAAPADAGFDVGAYLDSMFAGMDGGGAPAAMPSAAEIAAAHSVSRKAARHRTQAEKDTLAAFNAAYGPIGQYL